MLPHAPAQLEMLALEACLQRVDAQGGLPVLEARHASAAAAARAGAVALGAGLEPYVREASEAAPVATTLRAPAGVDAAELVARALAADPSAPLAAGGGALAREMVRVNHYGPAATPEAVRACLDALGTALAGLGRPADPQAARAAAAGSWRR